MPIHRRDRLPYFSISTNGRLGRALIDALQGRSRMSRRQLDDVVSDATRELRSAGLCDRAVLATLGEIVEDTGRECGADRPSLLTGELRWRAVQIRVLERAAVALAGPATSAITESLIA